MDWASNFSSISAKICFENLPQIPYHILNATVKTDFSQQSKLATLYLLIKKKKNQIATHAQKSVTGLMSSLSRKKGKSDSETF